MSRLPAGRIANRYEIREKLGQGGMGAVYRAYDRLAGQEVALKQVLLSPGQLNFTSKAGTDDTDKLRLDLAHEFAILAGLRHPHILSVLDYGFDAQRQPFYTMTLLENGQDFRTYAREQPDAVRYDLIAQMLQALHYLHRRGVLHRDLKPYNVFVTPEGQVRVMDFGLAKADKQRSSTDKDSISGTVSYMSPELFQGVAASVASDLYAAGVMAYEILIGRYPYTYAHVGMLMMQIMMQDVTYDDAPEDIAGWLAQLLAKDPAARFPSAYDALLALYAALDQDIPPENRAIRESFLQASTFVGRETELQQLTNALDTLKSKNAFFLVGGESGVGKSRLLDELRVQALVRGVTVLRGQAVEEGGLPFQVWREVVRRMLLMVEVTELQAGVLKDIVPDIDTLLGRQIDPAPELTGKAYQERLVLTIVDLLRAVNAPTLLILEDLQWAVESLEPLKQILLVQEQLPTLMIVGNYRDDEAPDLPEKLASMTHIKLDRLTQDAVSELSSAMLGDVGMNEEVVELLHSQSEGNLFFLVETVRALAEASGDLESIGQGELPEDVFTGGMQAVVRRRLSKVDAQYSDIQTLAAIIGREIDTKLLEHAHDAVLVEAWLRNTADYGVVDIHDNTWRFAHDKLRETLIADVPDDALPPIHRTAAETIEAVYPDDAGYNEALLAHWQAAGDLDKTYAYLLPVAKHMIELSGTYPIAETHLHQMLERLPEDDGRRIVLWNTLADSAERQANYNASQGYALQAQELATALDDREGLAKSLNHLGIIATYQGEYARANDLYQQSLVIFQQLGDQYGIAECLNNIGTIAARQGEYARANDLIQQSLVIYQQLGDQRITAMCLNNLGRIATYQGEYARANDLIQQSIVIFQQLGDQRSIAMCLNNLGMIARYQGEYARATDLYQQSLAIRQQLGDQRGIANSLNSIGMIARYQGEYTRATDLYQQSMVIFQQLGDQSGIAVCLSNLGTTARYQGEYTRATDLYQQSMVIFQQLGAQYGVAYLLSNLGIIALDQRESANAADFFQQSLAIAQEIQAVPIILMNIVGFARYFLIQGQIERAAHFIGMVRNHPAQDNQVRDELEKVRPQLEAAFAPDELQAALDHGATLELETVVAELLAEFGPHGDNSDTA